MNLGYVLFTIMLVTLTLVSGNNAVSYLIEQGNDLFNQGNYSGSINFYNKAIELGNQINAPIFNNIVVQCEFKLDAIDTINQSQSFLKISSGPTSSISDRVRIGSENPSISFDISNPNGMHMRISNIYVNMIKYNRITNPKVLQNFAKGYNRGYSCFIKPAIGSYECVLKADDYDFIDLAPNELEHIVINVGAETPGAYELEISLDYAIGSEAHSINVMDVPVTVSFFDKNLMNEMV